MRDRTVNRVESWDARPFSGGFGTLRDLADGSFSGVVVSGDAWLFMLNGRVVGIVDGDIDDFEDASGTMYEAPDPALPLLFSMQERGGTTQAKYYTNDTPLEEADKTLSDANFTGYVELSENVLSGDYYLVYYGGRVLPVAFVGTTEELKTGDTAYDLAADEVGVYEVIKTPVNVTQVPSAPDSSDDDAAGAAGAAGAAAGASAAGDTDADADADSSSSAAAGDSSSTESPASDAAEGSADDTSPPAADSAASPESVAEQAEPDRTPDEAESRPTETDTSETSEPPAAESGDADSVVESAPDSESTGSADRGSSGASASDSDSHARERSGGAEEVAEGDERTVFSEEEQWRKTKSIPSLTPTEREKRRRQAEGSGAEQGARSGSKRKPSDPGSDQDRAARRNQAKQSKQSDAESPSKSGGRAQDASTEQTQEVSSTAQRSASGESSASTAALEERIGELEAELERVGAERNSLAADLESVENERDELERRVRQLEEALEEAGGKPTAGPTLTPSEALAGTNLFIRYGSKGQPTLDDLSGKTPDPEAINKNLRIDHHTQFESKDASVDGAPFEQFLERTPVFRFVSWLVRELPYEILDAGHRNGLNDLYGVVPDIDRAEIQGTVRVETDDGSEQRDFDVVLRDRMGNPLVVTDLNDARDPVTGDEMESLIESAQVVGDGAETLGAAFYVTASFFAPDALENTSEATANGGILSRSDRLSYVKLARKRGFHLCLAEDRNETFHLTVPEL